MKKWFIKGFAAILCIAVMDMGITIFAASPPGGSNASEWARDKVARAYELGIVPNELIGKEQDNITKKELSIMAMGFYEALTGEAGTTLEPSPFTDEASPYVVKAVQMGVISGANDTLFLPDNFLMREQVAYMIVNTLKASKLKFDVEKARTHTFQDQEEIDAAFVSSVNFLCDANVINGNDGYFYPKAYVTVEQAISMYLHAYDSFKNDDIEINGKSVKIGDPLSYVTSTFGEPDSIVNSELGGQRYIYSSDLQNFLIIGIKNDLVIEIFSNAIGVRYNGIGIGTKIEDTEYSIKTGEKNKAVIENYLEEIQLLFDSNNQYKLDAVYVRDKEAPIDFTKHTQDLADQIDDTLFEMINSARVSRGLKPLVWNDQAANNARAQSRDMVVNDYVSYTNTKGWDAFKRLRQSGVKYTDAVELITADGNSLFSTYEFLLSSLGYHKSIFSKDYVYGGIGAAPRSGKIYTTIDLYDYRIQNKKTGSEVDISGQEAETNWPDDDNTKQEANVNEQ